MQQSITNETHSRINSFLLYCGIIGAILFGLINFAFAAVNTDYIIGRQPIGDLELLKHGWIQSADFILFGLFTWAFAIGLHREITSGFGSSLIPLSQEAAALGLIIAGVFTHDPIHEVSGIVIFTSMTAGFFLFAYRFRQDVQWRGLVGYTLISGILMIVFLVLFAYARTGHGNYAGLYERAAMMT